MTMAMLILGAFVTPALFWGGLGAMSAPIIIHLLARRRFRRVRWAAMRFLVEAERENRRRVRIEELILLALRCLAVLLIGLVVSRPFVSPEGVAAILGGSERTERVVVIDDSLSMGYASAEQIAFERAKQSVVNLIERLREHAPQDTMTVLKSSQPDAPLVAGAILDDKQIEQLLARLEALHPSQRGLSVEACMAGAVTALDLDPELLNAAVYVVSDFQRVDWIDRGGATGERGSLENQLVKWAGEDKSIRLILVDVGDDAARNLAVTGLRPMSRQIVAGVEAPFAARVGNFTPAEVENLELQVATDRSTEASAPLDRLGAFRETTVKIPLRFEQAGDGSVRVELPPDNLPADNVRHLAVEVNEAVRILVVNGEPSGDSYLDETHLLETALRPEGSIASGNIVEEIPEVDLDTVTFDKYHLVILCNLYRISEPAAEALHRYVFDGGGLAIFLGDQVADPVLYNATLYRGGTGLLPAALQGIVSAPQQGVELAASDFLHPVVRVFSGQENPFLKRIAFFQYYATEPADSAADEDSAAYRPATNVIARFDDPDGTPAIMERPYGRGRVMLFTSSADLEWNNWAKDPSYVVAMLEIAQYLARASDLDRSVEVGAPLTLEIDPSRWELSAVVRPPGYPQQQEEEISAVATENGAMELRWPHTEQTGVYAFRLRQRDGTETVRRFAVNPTPQESDLTPATEEELRRALAGLPVEYVNNVTQTNEETDEGRRELWQAFLLAALGVLMLEQFLAWRFGRV